MQERVETIDFSLGFRIWVKELYDCLYNSKKVWEYLRTFTSGQSAQNRLNVRFSVWQNRSMQTSTLRTPQYKLHLVPEGTFTRHVNNAFKDYHSILALSRSPLAQTDLIVPALVLDDVSPTADERGHALRLVLQWAVEKLAPAPVHTPIGSYRPYDDPTWRDPRWWRYNILRHRYLEPLHPDEFVEGGRFTETLIALTGLPSADTFFDERNRAIQDVAQWLWQQRVERSADSVLRRMALSEAVRPLQTQPDALALLDIAAAFDEVFPRDLLLRIAANERLANIESSLRYLTTQRFLLTGDSGNSLGISLVLQSYIYQRLPKDRLQRIHYACAKYYATLDEPLKAAEHWQKAGYWTEAANILLAAANDLINELQTNELRDVLLQFKASYLAADLWREIQIALCDLSVKLGQHTEALAACRRALKATTETHQQARIYRRMGKLYEQRNQQHALAYYQQAVERFRDDAPELIDLLKDRGWFYILRREWSKAEADLTQALAHAPQLAHEQRADIYDALASLQREQQHYAEAVEYARTALTLREESGNMPRVADSCNNLGLLYNAIGDYSHAIAAYEEAMLTYERLDNRERLAVALLNLGMAHHLAGRMSQAIETYQKSLAICEETGLALVQVRAQYNLAEAMAELGKSQQAVSYWQAGYAQSREAGFDDEITDFENLRTQFPILQAATVAPDPASTSAHWGRKQALEPEDQIALSIAEQYGQVTPKALVAAANISKATATRRLSSLVEREYLVQRGKGRSTHYTLPAAPAAWETPASAQHAESDVVAAQLKHLLYTQRRWMREQYAVDAMGISDEQLPGNMVRLRVRFVQLPDVHTFFDLEGRLNDLLHRTVDLLPVDDTRDADSSEHIVWIW
jgi:tetratricopeptide (TPR) repeat protein